MLRVALIARPRDAAQSALVPSMGAVINQFGDVEAASNSTQRLFPGNGLAWNVGAQAIAPLFGGRRDSLRALDHDAQTLLAQEEAPAAAEQALRLIHANYGAGPCQDTVALIAALGRG